MAVLTPSTVRVPYVNIAGQHRAIKEELLAAVGAVLDSGQFILGPAVQQFEERFAELCGTRHAVGVNSCTDALVLALQVLGIGPGDEVIVPPNSFIASATSVCLAGATPVFVDAADDYTIDPRLIEAALTPRTRALMPVHLTGQPADMDAINALAGRHHLAVVEDAAQAVMAAVHGRRVGGLGTIGCFSLHPLKNLNACGDAGVITSNDTAVADRLRILRNIGLQTRDNCVAWSGNSRLDSVQAAMLNVKLRYLPQWTEGRRSNAAFYRQALADVSGVTLPVHHPDRYAVYHTFIIQVERRDDLKRHLAELGVETGIHYPVPIHLHPCAAHLGHRPGAFPVTERQAQRILSLPVYPELTAEQREAVVEGIRSFFGT